MTDLQILEDLLNQKKYERMKIVQHLSILQVEMKDLQKKIDSQLIEKKMIDYQMNLFEREVNKNAN